MQILELGAMLLARILPGYNLKALQDEDERLHIALEVISKSAYAYRAATIYSCFFGLD